MGWVLDIKRQNSLELINMRPLKIPIFLSDFTRDGHAKFLGQIRFDSSGGSVFLDALTSGLQKSLTIESRFLTFMENVHYVLTKRSMFILQMLNMYSDKCSTCI